ncbi:MAG: hypothetical protein COV70_03800 [Parcubacteria group bacterium CG11_big_fil_rev_8_21_14_0_20_39_22]|nr:MAG: hypothetical protein COV70_03800 [Parcubacteria group bacterium CG11_big_fil_rev_8_21_14_0_20_39_22]
MKDKNILSTIKTILGLIIVGVFIAGVFFWYTSSDKVSKPNDPSSVNVSQVSIMKEGWKSYRNERLKIEIDYPAAEGGYGIFEIPSNNSKTNDGIFFINRDIIDFPPESALKAMPHISIVVFDNLKYQPLLSFASDFVRDGEMDSKTYEVGKLQGEDAVWFSYMENGRLIDNLAISRLEKIYVMSAFGNKGDKVFGDFTEMSRTIRFIK